MREDQQSDGVVLCPSFLIGILDPQVCFSSLMGWSKTSAGAATCYRRIYLALLPIPSLLLTFKCTNRGKKKLQYVHLPLWSIFLFSAFYIFMPWLPLAAIWYPDLFVCSAFLVVFSRGFVYSKILHMPHHWIFISHIKQYQNKQFSTFVKQYMGTIIGDS